MAKKQTRKTASSISIDTNVRCRRVYPTEGTRRSVEELKTIGIRLTRDQALHLARVLLAACQDWDDIDLTAYRNDPRQSDGTYRVTVTSPNRPAESDAALSTAS